MAGGVLLDRAPQRLERPVGGFEVPRFAEQVAEGIDSTPRLWCSVDWRPNTQTFWDNRCTQHHAVWDYYPHTRYGERVSILGEERPAA